MKLSDLVVIYPNSCSLKGSEGQQTMSEHFSWAKISSAESEMHELKSGFTLQKVIETTYNLQRHPKIQLKLFKL